jgi:hypothetical protein
MSRNTKEYLDKVRLEKSEARYTVKGMLNDELYNLMHLERRRFFYTALDLTIRPAYAIRKVISGHRKYLYSYVNYFILIATITIFLSVRYHFFVSGYDLGDQHGYLEDLLNWMGFDRQFRIDFFFYAEEFANIVNFVAVPVFTIASYLAFYKNKHNIAEHLVLNVYICAQQLLFVWFTIPFLEIFPDHKDVIIAVYTVATVIYNLWVLTTFFEGKWWVNLLKGSAALAIAYTVQVPINYSVFYILRPFIKLLDTVF